METNVKHTTLIVRPEFKEPLRQAAGMLGISMGNLIEILIGEYLPLIIKGQAMWPSEAAKDRVVSVVAAWKEDAL